MPSSQLRSASLTNYAEVARSLGLDPFAQLRAAGLDVQCLSNPDLKIPVLRVHALLESSAHAAGVEDFGLRMAMSRRLSNLGLIALAAREEPTVRDALHCLQRTMHLHNESLRLVIEEENDVVVLREQILARVQGSSRQGIELPSRGLYRIIRQILGDSWTPRPVHPRPEKRRLSSPRRELRLHPRARSRKWATSSCAPRAPRRSPWRTARAPWSCRSCRSRSGSPRARTRTAAK